VVCIHVHTIPSIRIIHRGSVVLQLEPALQPAYPVDVLVDETLWADVKDALRPGVLSAADVLRAAKRAHMWFRLECVSQCERETPLSYIFPLRQLRRTLAAACEGERAPLDFLEGTAALCLEAPRDGDVSLSVDCFRCALLCVRSVCSMSDGLFMRLEQWAVCHFLCLSVDRSTNIPHICTLVAPCGSRCSSTVACQTASPWFCTSVWRCCLQSTVQ
jgi:hypothetical protein